MEYVVSTEITFCEPPFTLISSIDVVACIVMCILLFTLSKNAYVSWNAGKVGIQTVDTF